MTSFTEGTVDVPGAGRMKKAYIVVPGVVAAGYIGWRWYQARKDAAAAPPSSDGTYSTSDLTDMGLSTTGGATNVTGNTGSTTTDGTTSTAIDDNAEWTNVATDKLTQQGWDGQVVQGALGDFLARRSLDKTEATIVRAAIAVAGQPPVGGPFPVLEQAGTGTGTLPAPTNLRRWGINDATHLGIEWDPVPGAAFYRLYSPSQGGEPVGDSLDTKWQGKGLKPHTSHSYYVVAYGTTLKPGGKSSVYTATTATVKLGKPSGLHASAVTKSSFRVTVNKVPGAEYYRWYLNGHDAGSSDAGIPYRDFHGLHSKTTYHVTVAADTTNQPPGPQSSALSVKTK